MIVENNPLKIAHIATVDLSLRYLLLNQLKYLQTAGYDVTGISAPGPDVPVLTAAGIRHIAVPLTRNVTPITDLVALVQLVKIMRCEKFTIVHAHTPKAGLLGQLAARMVGTPVIINTLHGFYFHENMPRSKQKFLITLEKIATRCSNVILSQNGEDIDIALREKICLPDKIKYLGNGIDLTQFNPQRFSPELIKLRRRELGFDENTPVVGFVGRLAARRKGFLDFLTAGAKILAKKPNTRFLIIGEADKGKSDAVHPAQVKDFGIEHACLFLGHISNDDLPLLYCTMNVLVLPSVFEGIPRVVMEAAAMAIPAVVTNVKGNREVVSDRLTGLLIPYGDTQALTDAVIEIIDSPIKARRLGQAARLKAEREFDEQLVFERVKAIYRELLARKGLAAPSRTNLSKGKN